MSHYCDTALKRKCQLYHPVSNIVYGCISRLTVPRLIAKRHEFCRLKSIQNLAQVTETRNLEFFLMPYPVASDSVQSDIYDKYGQTLDVGLQRLGGSCPNSRKKRFSVHELHAKAQARELL